MSHGSLFPTCQTRGSGFLLLLSLSAQVVQGEGPGARYAHVLALVGQRFLLVLGGNDGYKVIMRKRLGSALRLTRSRHAQPLADAWALDTAMKPYKWQSVQATGEGPCARMYAAAAARADGLLLLCGGRDANNSPLVCPETCATFKYSLLFFILGGRVWPRSTPRWALGVGGGSCSCADATLPGAQPSLLTRACAHI